MGSIVVDLAWTLSSRHEEVVGFELPVEGELSFILFLMQAFGSTELFTSSQRKLTVVPMVYRLARVLLFLEDCAIRDEAWMICQTPRSCSSAHSRPRSARNGWSP